MSSEDTIVSDIISELEQHSKFDEDDIEECTQLLEDHYRDVSLEDYRIYLDEIFVNNFELVDKKEEELNGEDILLYGRNRSGKTSFLEALEFNLAGLPENQYRSDYELTNLITTGKSTATTNTYWNRNGDRYKINRVLKRDGNELTRYQYPRVTSFPEQQTLREDSRDTQTKVSELIGITPIESRLKERDYDLYRILGLFFLMSKDWRLFLDWDKSSKMLDILFRVNLTNVINASQNRMEEEYPIAPEAEQASYELENKRNERDRLQSELEELEQERNKVSNRLTDKKNQLETIQRSLKEDQEIDYDELQSRKSSLLTREASLERDITKISNDLARVNKLINRYEDEDLRDDFNVVGDEVQSLMSVPDLCPICSNKVEPEDKEQLFEDHNCPLCHKDMPEERVRVEKEYQAEESITAIQERQQEKLDDLHSQREDLETELDSKQEKLDSTKEQIEEVEDQLEEGDALELTSQRGDLEDEIHELEDRLTQIQSNIRSLKNEIESVEEEVEELEVLYEEFDENNSKRDVLTTFNKIVREKRNEEQRKLKNNLAEVMEELTEYFDEGLLGDVETVKFPDKGSYKFEIHKSDGTTLYSESTQESAAEVVLHALLFHTAVLKELSRTDRNIPFRLFVIDSAFSNEQDVYNKGDLADFLSELPNILEEYQVIMSMAEIDVDTTQFEHAYRKIDF